MQMDDHWHTYWKNPGDSGIPTTLEWTLPEGVTASEIHWPYPKKIDLPPLTTYGFEDKILLLVKIHVPENIDKSTPFLMKTHAKWLACENICIPGEAQFEISLPIKSETPLPNKNWVETFARARSLLPLHHSDWKISATESAKHLNIQLNSASSENSLRNIYFFPDSAEIIDHHANQIISRNAQGYEIKIQKSDLSTKPLSNLSGVIVNESGWRGEGSEKSLAVDSPVEFIASEEKTFSLLTALLFAFLGGLILNLMPCVLPVLSIKILNFIEHAGNSKAKLASQGLFFTLGVMVSFWILALMLIFFRSVGNQIGWGFQLQSPIFVGILASVFFLFALNLFGIFEIGLRLSSVGGNIKRDGLAGSFSSGILATIVATPCTAPFMGSALGFALTQPPSVALLIFSSLGFGMATPYLLLSLFPGALRHIPKAGAWMISLKRILGLLMLASCVWLLWVLTLQARSGSPIPGIVLGLAVIGFGAWRFGRTQNFKRNLLIILLGTAVIAGSTHITFIKSGDNNSLIKQEGIAWIPFSNKLLEESLGKGDAVFIDFTAAWCLSCQVNERVVLNSQKIVSLFKEKGIVALKADWTSRDDKITKALASYGRSSIPLYVYYSKGSRVYKLLPEIITQDIVLKELS